MKKIIILLIITTVSSWAQVGIGTTSPNATLDIRATNPSTASNTDGILIPRVDDFPLTSNNPGVNQDGMLVFATGNGTPSKGFYYWNNTASNWEKIKSGGNNNIPFVTRAELDAITTPENGQLVYNSTNDVTLMWNGINWIVLSDDCFPQPTIANAGGNQFFNDATTSTPLTANTPTEGTGLWFIVSGAGGSFVDATNPTTTFAGNSCESYILRWTITSACGSSNDDVTISFSQIPTTAVAGPDQNFNDGTISTTLAANTSTVGTGMWTITSGTGGSFIDATDPTTTFTGNLCTNYGLRWTITSACGNTSNDYVWIYFQQTPTTANAGPTQTLTDNVTTTVTLAANTPTVGTGMWSVYSGTGGSFADATDPNTTFTGNLCTTYNLRWTISSCTQSIDYVLVRFLAGTIYYSSAGTDVYSLSNTTVTLNATVPTIGSGAWSIISGGTGTFADATNPTTTFTGNDNTRYTLRWRVTGCNNSQFDDVDIYIGIVIGQNAYGGVIFYVDGTGTSGLVVGTTEQGLQRWTCTSTNITGATGTAIGTGNSNTTAIVDATCGATPYAANTCRNLTLSGFSDWFLPSYNELQQLRNQRNTVNTTLLVIGGTPIVNNYYWTSTQSSTTTARTVYMPTGATTSTSKIVNVRVRAVRAF